jgi:inorganic pyrophosphatase
MFKLLQKELNNPIKQDIKNEKLRFYPYNITWNYGFLPQTWEDPAHKNEEAGAAITADICEVASLCFDLPFGPLNHDLFRLVFACT